MAPPRQPTWLLVAASVGATGVASVLGFCFFLALFFAGDGALESKSEAVFYASLVPLFFSTGLMPLAAAGCFVLLRRWVARDDVPRRRWTIWLSVMPLVALGLLAIIAALNVPLVWSNSARDRYEVIALRILTFLQLVGLPFLIALLWRVRAGNRPVVAPVPHSTP